MSINKTKKFEIPWFWIVIFIGLFWGHIEKLYNRVKEYYDVGRSVDKNYIEYFQPK